MPPAARSRYNESVLFSLIALSVAAAPARAQTSEQAWARQSSEVFSSAAETRGRLLSAAASGAPDSCDLFESEMGRAFGDLRQRALNRGERLESRAAALEQMQLLSFARRSCRTSRGEIVEWVNGWSGARTLGGVLSTLRAGDDPARDELELSAAQRLLDIASRYRVRQGWFVVSESLSSLPWTSKQHELAAMAIDTVVWGLCGYRTDVAPNYARILTDAPGVSDSVLDQTVARLRAIAAAEAIPELKAAASRAAEFLAASREAGRRDYAGPEEREQTFRRLYDAYGGGEGRAYENMPGAAAVLELPILQR